MGVYALFEPVTGSAGLTAPGRAVLYSFWRPAMPLTRHSGAAYTRQGDHNVKRHNINTTLFRSAGFDPTFGVLELEYRNGSLRRWLAVPARVYQAFCAAADPDAFFRGSIDGRFISLRGRCGPQ